jgi:hypothetical protein
VDHAFFDNMSPDEAAEFLHLYLSTESRACARLVGRARDRGVTADYSPDSVPDMFEWVFGFVRTVPLEPDMDEPEWIRTTPSYTASLFDFDEDSKPVVLAASFYLGESFVRTFPNHLSWATGDVNYIGANQPVVTGFRHGLEMSTVLVTENMFARVIKDRAKLPDIDRGVRYWTGLVDL